MSTTGDLIAQQLTTLIDKQGTILTDVALIKQAIEPLKDHETRLRSLESLRARLGAIWAAAVVVGAILGYLASYFGGHK